jgi:Cu/Ag efflux pump CusA
LPGDARRQASTLVSGLTVGNFFADQAVFDVTVQGVQAARTNLNAVRSLLIDTAGGGHVPLSSIASVGVHADPVDIEHEALSRYADVRATVHANAAGSPQDQLRRQLARLSFPLGYHAEVIGPTPERGTSHATFLSYFLAAAMGILLLLHAALRSWRLAALAFLTLPTALGGGLLVALATGELSSLGTAVGLLGVLAFACRQGLLVLAEIRRTHVGEDSTLSAEIVISAAGLRLPGALSGTIAAAAVLLPFSVSGSLAGTETVHVAAAVAVGGLVSTVLSTTLLLPGRYFTFGPHAPVADEATVPELAAQAAAASDQERLV